MSSSGWLEFFGLGRGLRVELTGDRELLAGPDRHEKEHHGEHDEGPGAQARRALAEVLALGV